MLPTVLNAVPCTGCSAALWSSTTTVRSAWLPEASARCVETMGDLTVTAPVVVKVTGPHNPISLSGGDGFQSTQLIPRSCGVGANVSTASTFDFPGCASAEIFKS